MIVVDGRFGPSTRAAVIEFQGGAGLSPDGVVGPHTWSALTSGPAQPTEPSTSPELIALLQARLDQVLNAVRLVGSGGPTEMPLPPVALRAVKRQEDEADDEDLLDTLGETVGGIVGGIGHTVGEIVGGIGQTVGEIVGGIGETVGEVVGGNVSEVWQGVQQRASELQRQLSVLGDEARRRLGPELAQIEQAVADLGRGVRLDGFQLGQILAVLEELVSGIDMAAALKAGTFEDDVKFTTTDVKIDGTGLSEIDEAATKVMGPKEVGHVSFTAGPTFQFDVDSKGAVNAAKVTAKGVAKVPTPGKVRQKFIVDPTVTGDRKQIQEKMAAEEREGIRNYFTLANAHEAEHVKRYNNAFAGLAKRLEGKTAEDANSAFNAAVCAARGSQADLDDESGCLVVTNERFVETAGAARCGLPTSRCAKT